MRVIALLALLLCLGHSAAAGQQGGVQPQLLDVLHRMETGFAQRDSAGVRALLAPGYTSTDQSGVYDASQVVERVTNNPPGMTFHEQILEPTTRLSAAADSAVLRYHSILNLEMQGRGRSRKEVSHRGHGGYGQNAALPPRPPCHHCHHPDHRPPRVEVVLLTKLAPSRPNPAPCRGGIGVG